MSEAGQEASAFCSALLGGPDGTGDDRLTGLSVCVWSLPGKRTRWIPAEVPEAIASAIMEEVGRQPDAVHAVYIGLGFVPDEIVEKKGDGRRAEARDIAGIPGLWADIDIAGHGHRKDGLPPDMPTAFAILDAVGLVPTVVLDSGHGLQAWWAFAEPIVFENDTERDAVAAVAYGWNLTLKARAHQLGGWSAGVDSVFNLDRLMRAPGSINTKGADGKHGGPATDHRPVRILNINMANRYELDDFQEQFATDEDIAMTAARTVSGHAATVLPGVDLLAVWQRATSTGSKERGYVPDFLMFMLDVDPNGLLAATWNGQRTEFAGDQSRYDAALVRLLADAGCGPADQVEAIMCRRLLAGADTTKVDPSKRTDYLTRTVLNVAAMVETSATKRNALAKDITALTERPVLLASEEDATSDNHVDNPALDKELPLVSGDAPVNATEDATAVPLTLVSTPTGPPREPRRALVIVSEDDPWGTRHPDTVETLAKLDLLLIPEKYRAAGVCVWNMEHKDYGEAQKGRLLVKVPSNYVWPGGGPSLYRPGLPLKAEWYQKASFEVPKGFRMSMDRDVMIPAEPVGNRKEEWNALISELVGHWQRDSSGSDLATAANGWLLDYLITHPATTVEAEAVDMRRAYLTDTGEWGAKGAPRVLIMFTAFTEYTATQAGGVTGRNGRNLLSYLRLKPVRPRMMGPDGAVKRRANWYEIEVTQFDTDEWGQVLCAAQEQLTAREERNLRLMQGGKA